MIDFSYIPRLNQALETEQEVQQLWEDLEAMSVDDNGSEDDPNDVQGQRNSVMGDGNQSGE